jgi:serine protease Do
MINSLSQRLAAPIALVLSIGTLGWGCGSAVSGSHNDPTVAHPPIQPVSADGPTLQLSPHAATPTTSSVADLAEQVGPTVVNITTTHLVSTSQGVRPFDMFFPEMPHPRVPRQRTGAGTGFIIDREGFIVTNAHVVDDADEVKVRLIDDRELTAEVIGRDVKLDLALLKVSAAARLPSVVLGDSNALRVGEQVLAVGNPFGLGHSVSLGIVSAKARSIGAGPYDDFIQTDASINPGNSGGPLFNLRGEVIGINTAIRAGADGIGFAIPVDVLKDVMAQLKNKGFVERGKLGLTFQPVTSEIASALGLDRPHGALVNDVIEDSAADKAGIKPGDLIVAVDDVAIHRSEELARTVARHAPGSSIDVKLLRQGKTMSLKAVLEKLDEDPHRSAKPRRGAPPKRDKMLGLEVDEDPQGGVRVLEMSRPVEGLRPGDVIVEVGGTPIGAVDDLRAALAPKQKGETALLRVRREGKSYFVGLPIE